MSPRGVRKPVAVLAAAAPIAMILVVYLALRSEPPEAGRPAVTTTQRGVAAPESLRAAPESAHIPGEGLAEPEAPAELDAPSLDRANVRAALERVLADRRPDVRLTSGQLESLVDAVIRLEEANREITALGASPGDERRIAALHEEADRAAEEARAIVELPIFDVPRLR